MTTILGAKLLTPDCRSLTGGALAVTYTTEWQRIDGYGSFVAVTGGLCSGGSDGALHLVEAREPTGEEAPKGVVCYRYARLAPERALGELAPSLLVDIADWAAEYGHADILAQCTAAGARPTHRGADDAARNGHADALAVCIAAGALPTPHGADGAAEYGHADTLALCESVGVFPTPDRTA